jgi:Fanconi anemia group M protein
MPKQTSVPAERQAVYVEHAWINPSTIEYRAYQENIVKTATGGNTLCVLPTGLGKTSIAALVAANRLEKISSGKVLFLAPTRPLVEQHRKTFEKYFRLGLEMKTVTGEDKPETRSALYSSSDIIFSTPQTIRNDLKNGSLHLRDFILCVFDEAHRCSGDYAYAYIARAYTREAKQPLILALTASPGSNKYKIDEIRNKLSIDRVEIRTRDDSDVRPYVQEVQNEWAEVELTAEMKSIRSYLEAVKNARIKKLMDWHVINSYRTTKSQLIQLQQALAKKKTGSAWMAMSYIAEIIKIDHALLLLETQTLYSLKEYLDEMMKGTTRAVARLAKEQGVKDSVRIVDELVSEGKEHPKIEKLRSIIEAELSRNKEARIIIFAQYRSTIDKIFRTMQGIKSAAPVEFIGQAKKKGKGLSQKEQVQILNEFKMGFYNILCASQVAEEGLDVVETDMVIFYEPVPSAIRKIQRTGRTARTKIGSVIVLLAKNTRDEAYNWSSVQKEKKMKTMLYGMQRKGSRASVNKSTNYKEDAKTEDYKDDGNDYKDSDKKDYKDDKQRSLEDF